MPKGGKEYYMCMIEYNRKELGKKDTVYVTQHAEERMKERFSWSNRRTQERMLKKVIDDPSTKNVSGKLLRYVQNKMDAYGDSSVRVYGEYLFVLNEAENALITVYDVAKLSQKHKDRNYKREHNYNIAYCD